MWSKQKFKLFVIFWKQKLNKGLIAAFLAQNPKMFGEGLFAWRNLGKSAQSVHSNKDAFQLFTVTIKRNRIKISTKQGGGERVDQIKCS